MKISEVKTGGATGIGVLNEAELVVTTTGEILKNRTGSYKQRVLIVDDASGRIINDYSHWRKFNDISDQELEDEVKRRGLSW